MYKEDLTIIKNAKFSEADFRGSITIDCIECERGYKGSDPNKCAAGYKYKRGGRGSCFSFYKNIRIG